MLLRNVVQLGNLGLQVSSVCGAQIPITICEEVIVKMRVGLNTVYLCHIFFEVIAGFLPML